MSDSVLADQVNTTRPDESDFTTLIGIDIGAVIIGVLAAELTCTKPKSILSFWSKMSIVNVLVGIV